MCLSVCVCVCVHMMMKNVFLWSCLHYIVHKRIEKAIVNVLKQEMNFYIGYMGNIWGDWEDKNV